MLGYMAQVVGAVTIEDVIVRIAVGMAVILGAASVAGLLRFFGEFRSLKATLDAQEVARKEREEARDAAQREREEIRREDVKRMHDETRDSFAAHSKWEADHLDWAEGQKSKLYQDLVGKAEFNATVAGLHGAIGNVSGQIGELRGAIAELRKRE